MKRYINGLGDVMKDQDRFYSLPKEIQKSVFNYLNFHRSKKRLEKKKKELISDFNKKKKELEKEIKKVTKEETKSYAVIKDLPNNYQLVNVYCESDKKSYRLDIHFCGFRKKCSLGTDLNKIQKSCDTFIKGLKEKVTPDNFKKVIVSCMIADLNDFIVENGFNKFRDSHKLKLNFQENKFEYIFQTLDTDMEERVKKSNRIVLDAKNKKKRSIGKIHGFGVND